MTVRCFILIIGVFFFYTGSNLAFSQEKQQGEEEKKDKQGFSILQKQADTVYRKNRTVRYFGSPSAFSLKKGNWYIRNEVFIMNYFSYGITNRLTVSTGLKSNLPYMVYGLFLEGKYSFIYRRNFSAAAGLCVNYDLFLAMVKGSAENTTSLKVYLLTTLGNDRYNLSARFDPYGYNHLSKTGGSLASLSLKAQIFRNFSFIAENHGFIPWDESPLPVRYFGKIGFGISIRRFNIGLAYGGLFFEDPEDSMIPYTMPFISLAYNKQ